MKHKVKVLSKEEVLSERSNKYDFIDISKEDIEKQRNYAEEQGNKIIEFTKKYQGTDKHNDIMLAIEFGYQLCNDYYTEE